MDLSTLKNSVCQKCNYEGGDFILEEKDKSATLTKVTMCNIPEGSLILKMDRIQFNNFLKDNKTWGFNKHSDYLIISEEKVVFIELKSKHEVKESLIKECIQKFTSDYCTTIYADHIFEQLLNKNAFFRNKEFHYVLVYQATSATKSPLATTQKLPNNKPSLFRKIGVSNGGTLSYCKTI